MAEFCKRCSEDLGMHHDMNTDFCEHCGNGEKSKLKEGQVFIILLFGWQTILFLM
jgi:ribosomal protein L37E